MVKFCISHCANILEKGLKLTILLSARVDSKVYWTLSLWYGNKSRRRKTTNSNLLNCLKTDLESHPFHDGRVG